MKTTVELPDALVRQIKFRALRERRKLKDAVADLLRKGLSASEEHENPEAELVVGTDKKTGLPLIRCKHSAIEEHEVTPDCVAEILSAQEAGWQHAAGG